MKFKYVVLIFNENSGQSNITRSQLETEISQISENYNLFILNEELDLNKTITKANDAGADLIVACGGDGTVLAVAEEASEHGIPLAVLPFGTANVFAAELGIAENSLHLLNCIKNDKFRKRKVDMGLAGEKKFLLRFGLGWEAVMSKETPARLKKQIGKISYLTTALNRRRDLKKSTYRIRTEAFRKKIRGYGCMICNSANLGHPNLKLLPNIKIDDGKLNVVIVKQSSFRSIVKLMVNYLLRYSREKKTTVDDFLLASFPAKEIIIEKDPAQPAAVDGEVIECTYPLEIKVLERALEVIVPGEND